MADQITYVPSEDERKANAAKALAEARKFEAEADKFQAEAQEAKARAQSALYKTENDRFIHDREKEKRDRELAEFGKSHIYHFTTVVNDESCKKCMNELNFWDKQDPKCDIEIMFDTPGGSVFAGMALYDYIQDLRKVHEITTSTRGMAASMGGILLQAGDKRVMGAESFILIHEVATYTGGKIGEIEDELALLKKMEERVLNIFASRSKLSKTKLKANWRRKDWWISSDEALKLGLVDEVR